METKTLADMIAMDLTEHQRHIAGMCYFSGNNGNLVFGYNEYINFCNQILEAVSGFHHEASRNSRTLSEKDKITIRESQELFKYAHRIMVADGKIELKGPEYFTKHAIMNIEALAYGTDWTHYIRYELFHKNFEDFKKGTGFLLMN